MGRRVLVRRRREISDIEQDARGTLSQDFRLSEKFIDSLMPICCCAAVFAAIYFVYHMPGPSRIWGELGIAFGVVVAGVCSAPIVLKFIRARGVDVCLIHVDHERVDALRFHRGQTVAALWPSYACPRGIAATKHLKIAYAASDLTGRNLNQSHSR